MADPPSPARSPAGTSAGVPAQEAILTGEIMQALDALPEEQRIALTTVLVSQEYHSGPLPTPKTLAGYAAILPEAPREILNMAHLEQAHMNAYRDRALNSEINYRLFTLIAAFSVVALMIIGAIVLGVTDHEKAAIALGAASGLTLIAGAFLRGRDLFPKVGPQKPTPAKPSRNRTPARSRRPNK